MSVLANITWGLKVRGISERESREIARRALEEVDLINFENRHARSLSGGESQRVALARALVLDPEVLLLDEPENHLDKVSAARTEEIFLRMNRDEGKTVIFTTHNLHRGQRLAHRVFNLFRGKTVPADPDNLFRGELSEDGSAFRTDRISVKLPIAETQGRYLTIDPRGIILSHHLPHPSIPNTFEGRVVAMSEENGQIRVQVEAGERLHLIMSSDASIVRETELGQRVWLVVKEGAITILL
jgi:ABC-type sulfate/molybdate transport systems ATPase subunit